MPTSPTKGLQPLQNNGRLTPADDVDANLTYNVSVAQSAMASSRQNPKEVTFEEDKRADSRANLNSKLNTLTRNGFS